MSQTASKKPLGKTERLIWLLAQHAANDMADRVVLGFGKGHRETFMALSRNFRILNEVGGVALPAGVEMPRYLLDIFGEVVGIQKMGQFIAPDVEISPVSDSQDVERGDSERMTPHKVYVLCPKWFKAAGAERAASFVNGEGFHLRARGVDLSFLFNDSGFEKFKTQDHAYQGILPVVGAFDPDNRIMIFFDEAERRKMMDLFGITVQTPRQRRRSGGAPAAQPV